MAKPCPKCSKLRCKLIARVEGTYNARIGEKSGGCGCGAATNCDEKVCIRYKNKYNEGRLENQFGGQWKDFGAFVTVLAGTIKARIKYGKLTSRNGFRFPSHEA